MSSTKKMFIRVLAGIFISLSIFFFTQGFDKKDNYYNSDSYSIPSENAYVGGDAYNYIINANYFVGYSVIGSVMLLSGMLCLVVSESEKSNNQVINETIKEQIDQKDEEDKVLTKF